MTRKEKKINILTVKLRISQVIARLITVNFGEEEFLLKFTLLSDKRHLVGRTVESVIMVIHVPLQENRKRQKKNILRGFLNPRPRKIN